jgi:hypothetical protein
VDWYGTVELGGNAGTVWLEELRRDRAFSGLSDGQVPGLSVIQCDHVVVVRSSFLGEGGAVYDGVPARAGLEVRGGSRVIAYESTFEGGGGVCGIDTIMGNAICQEGGPGLTTDSAADLVFLSGCEVRGGRGSHYSGLFGEACSAGGPGAIASGRVTLLDSVLQGGPGGRDNGVPCAAGGFASIGPVERLAGASLAFSTGPLAHEGDDVVLAFRGPPRAEVWLMGSLSTGFQERRPQHGWLLLGTPRVLDHMGATDASGALDVLLPLGNLTPGFEVRRTFLQPLMIEGARSGTGKARAQPSRVTLGAGSAFLVLDSSF